MGAFNTVIAPAACPSCGCEVPTVVQFKYGNTNQLVYRIGDTIGWAGNDIGRPGRSSVVVDGIAETPCPKCGHSGPRDFYVYIQADRIVAVRESTGEHDFSILGQTFIEIEA